MIKGASFKLIILAFMGLALWGNHRTQQTLNQLRSELHITRLEPLENAPPVLAFTTVALGGFRGLIANYLWMRAAHHQENGRYFVDREARWPKRFAQSDEDAARLWTESERQTGLAAS